MKSRNTLKRKGALIPRSLLIRWGNLSSIFFQLRVGKTTSALCSSSLRGVANKITSERIEPLDEREKTFEDYGVKEHERKLMQDLIKKLNVSFTPSFNLVCRRIRNNHNNNHPMT
eukprot:TRINITY_DN1423_c0_g2_i12.p1 TRINITY_DN1423_c0_g2~~TRINITY_DN1423_c0_g2_i12.p1  ORF type:complete len:115 (+),score=4.71 TRINITY_DN1423_c0_g2_i12:232-576(+)